MSKRKRARSEAGKAGWQQELESIRADLAPAATSAEPSEVSGSSMLSARASSKERAGRAPYNFVPAPVRPRLDAEPPPAAGRYHDGLRSGVIQLTLTPLTAFYVRGMWDYRDYGTGLNSLGKPVEVKDQPEPFGLGSELRLPGSSLRGMIRTLVEILSDAPLDPISENRFPFRTVGASPNRDSPAYEPCHPTYLKCMRVVQAGYLHPTSTDEDWYIQPAKSISNLGTYYKYEERGAIRQESPDAVRFARPALPSGRDPTPVVALWEPESKSPPNPNCTFRGWRIQSGHMEGKRHQWIINEPDAERPRILLSQEDVKKHRRAGLVDWLDKVNAETHREGVPCFYAQVEINGQQRIYFGPTRNFRLPYEVTTAQANPCPRPAGHPGWDLAEAVFGRLKSADGRAGARTRVFFEDARLEPRGQLQTELATAILGTPKPTSFQHYLVQESDRLEKSIPWSRDGQDPKMARLRGHKFYWHRTKPLPIILPREPKEQQITRFRKVKVTSDGSPGTFTASIRFENLRDHELGALLCAIELPVGCAHHLGMAKPLGLGTFRTEVSRLLLIDRKRRYSSFLASSGGHLETGGGEADSAKREEFKKVFVTKWHNCSIVEQMWHMPRFQELQALLTWDGLPADQDRWNATTRYLEFGKVHVEGDAQRRDFLYNEYTHVDQAVGRWPPDGGRGKRRPTSMQRRRPLPPATHVLEEAQRPSPVLPTDPRPPFVREE